jgi:hypothetical protein
LRRSDKSARDFSDIRIENSATFSGTKTPPPRARKFLAMTATSAIQ